MTPAGPAPAPVPAPAALLAAATALATAEDWPGLQALLQGVDDAAFDHRLLPLLLKLARRLPDPAAGERLVGLASRPGLAASPRIGLVMQMLQDASAPATAAAWQVFSANPALAAVPPSENALRCLARLALRLPHGADRDAAAALLARWRDGFPDAVELAGIEQRERLLLLAAADDWEGVCDLAAIMPDRHLLGDAAKKLLRAALHLGRPAEVRRVLPLMAEELAKPPRRLWVAGRLARAGLLEESFALLDVPELLAAAPETRLQMLGTLRLLARLAGPELQPRVKALIQGQTAPPLPPAGRQPFPVTPGLASPPLQPTLLFCAPALPPGQAAVFASLVERSRRDAAAGRLQGSVGRPQVLAYDEVTVNDRGGIWDAAGRLAPLLHRATLAGLQPAAAGAAEFDAAVVATDIPRNFYHWLAEGFPALAWRLHPGAPPWPVLVNERALPLMRQTLALLDDPLPLVMVRDPVRVRQAFVARRGFEWLQYWNCYGALYDRLVAGALRQAAGLATAPLLYLSRRGVARRAMANEAALEEALAGLGFHIVSFEGRPLAEQIALFQAAEVVVTPHGAGLAHLAAARSGLKVFELMQSQPGTEGIRSCYMRLSALRGHRHALWLEPAHPVTGDWQVDLPAMLPALRRFLEETPGR